MCQDDRTRMINRFCKEKEYPRIALHTLAGFSEDKQAAKKFMLRFLPWTLSLFAAFVCFGACIILPLWTQKYDPVPQIYVVGAGLSFAIGIALFIALWRRIVAEVPISPRSGQPMEVYQLEDTLKDEKYELIYVCHQSRTYFRMVLKSPGD